MENSKVIVTYCGKCDGDKNQKKLFSKTINYKDDETENHYHIVQCLGCDSVSFLREVQFANSPGTIERFSYPYPFDLRSSSTELLDEYSDAIPKAIYELYEEVIIAFDNDCVILAGIGLRTLVEAICIDQNIGGRNLKDKIEDLHKKGLISTSELPILDKLRLIGNVSAHQIKSIPLSKLEYALGIIDHVLKAIYVLPKLNKKLKF